LNSIPDGFLSLGVSMITATTLLSTILRARWKWSKKGKVINVELKVQTRHAWLASALLADLLAGCWKLASVAGSG
jgi:hypothetical protein